MWGAGITLFACLLLSVILYEGIEYSLLAEVDGFLDGEVHALLTTFSEHHGDFAAVEKEVRLELGSRSRRDLICRVLDSTSRLVVSSDPADRLPTAWQAPAHVDGASSRPSFTTVHSESLACDVRI